MDFFPSFILKRNRFRNTPHWSIALATGIPIIILLLVRGKINQLGDLYAFGLLGAFTLTCLGLDVIRTRERVVARRNHLSSPTYEDEYTQLVHPADAANAPSEVSLNSQKTRATPILSIRERLTALQRILHGLWKRFNFWLGLLTTALVALAWGISLVSKPEAALFGGTVALCGMAVASINYMNRGRPPVAVAQIGSRQRDAVLVMLSPNDPQTFDVIQTAINETQGKPLVFLYLGEQRREHMPRPLEIVDPYLDDEEARAAFAHAEKLARAARVPRRFIYRLRENTEPALVWSMLQPSDMIVSSHLAEQLPDINPDRIRYELTPNGKVAHLLKRW